MKPLMNALRVLTVAATSRQLAYVFFVGGKLMDFHIADKAARSTTEAVGALQIWINKYKPDILVTEKIDQNKRKGPKSKALIKAMQRIAAQNYLLDIAVQRVQRFANKYEEARHLAGYFSVVRPWIPKKRRYFDSEPRVMVMFEALALGYVVLKNPATSLALARDL